MSAEPKIHVIDDDEAVRSSLAFLIETAGHGVVTYPSAPAFLSALDGGPLGCVLTDVRMPEMTGLELLRTLRGRRIALPVIVMTGHGDVPLAVEAMKAGATDFLEKPFDDEVLLSALERALALEEADRGQKAELEAIAERLASLTAREAQVLAGLVAGRANKQIAHDLQISARTVEIYRANVMTKMRAKSLSELVRMALTAEASSPVA